MSDQGHQEPLPEYPYAWAEDAIYASGAGNASKTTTASSPESMDVDMGVSGFSGLMGGTYPAWTQTTDPELIRTSNSSQRQLDSSNCQPPREQTETFGGTFLPSLPITNLPESWTGVPGSCPWCHHPVPSTTTPNLPAPGSDLTPDPTTLPSFIQALPLPLVDDDAAITTADRIYDNFFDFSDQSLSSATTPASIDTPHMLSIGEQLSPIQLSLFPGGDPSHDRHSGVMQPNSNEGLVMIRLLSGGSPVISLPIHYQGLVLRIKM